MTLSRQIQKENNLPPPIAIVFLALLLIFGIFMVGYDQGQLFSLVQGEKAFADLFVHELFHDMRHAAGFPCH